MSFADLPSDALFFSLLLLIFRAHFSLTLTKNIDIFMTKNIATINIDKKSAKKRSALWSALFSAKKSGPLFGPLFLALKRAVCSWSALFSAKESGPFFGPLFLALFLSIFLAIF